MIPVRLTGVSEAERNAVSEAKEELGLLLSTQGIPVEAKKETEGAALSVTWQNGAACVIYCDIPALLRALFLLGGAVRDGKKEFRIQEKRCFNTCGAMFDCSRNAVLKPETVKFFIRRMAVMGMNTLLLYTEDLYEVEGEPYFGYMRGRFSVEDLRRLDDYADSLGVELIPCIQTLAHMEQFLKWNAAERYRDTAEVMLTGEAATYDLIDRMLASISGAVRTKKIHIGMDEAHTLGLGRYLESHSYKPRIELMQSHIAQVKKITDKYGLKPMMWGDMLFRLHINGGGYYDPEVQIPDEAAALIPEGIDQIYWDYYHHDEDFYHRYIAWYKKFGQTPVFAGGICTWTGAMVQNYNHTEKASRAALRACKSEGVKDVFTCIWNDNGGECNYLSVLPGLVFYAEHMYNENPDDLLMQERIKQFTGMDEAAWRALCAIDCIDPNLSPLEPQNPSKYLLWQDPLLGLFDKNVAHIDMEAYYQKVRAGLENALSAGVPELYRGLFTQMLTLCSILEVKARLGIRLKAAYDSGDKKALRETAGTVLPMLLEQVETLHALHAAEWEKLYKPFGWEVLDIRYGGLEARLRSAASRITAYLDGKIDRIEELEQERLTFDGREKIEDLWIGHYNSYHLMVTPNALG